MPNLDLNDDDAALLAEVLAAVLGDLRYEIADTDNSTFKADLKQRYDRIDAVAKQLPAPPSD